MTKNSAVNILLLDDDDSLSGFAPETASRAMSRAPSWFSIMLCSTRSGDGKSFSKILSGNTNERKSQADKIENALQ